VHDELIQEEFTRQAESFNRSAAANSAAIIERILDFAAPEPGERWLEAACGPGILARALAPRVKEVCGVDATPAMVELARREAASRGLTNVRFELADATAVPVEDDRFDGALARFALHHIPVPGRLFAELARVVRPGGSIVMADHVADGDQEAYAWSQELERLRDPSHWASLTAARLRALGRAARLELEQEAMIPFELDFDDWLARGSGAQQHLDLVERVLEARPEGTPSFTITTDHQRRTLRLRLSLTTWRVPAR